jgi:hypothetical protein
MAARSFAELVSLVRRAEEALVRRAGQTDASDRVTTLRGIYYGTSWSRDFRAEHSSLRNWGFFTYTAGADPIDPRPALGADLFAQLQASQSVADRGRRIDIGHALIGFDARNRALSRSVPIPTQGGTGLEIVTWLGDLGGGAANLAMQRLRQPSRSVEVVFHNRGFDYGAVDNLEGDAAGYLLACDSTAGGEPVYRRGEGVADVIARYLPTANEREWSTRAGRFAVALGAEIRQGQLSGVDALISRLRDQIADFAAWYISTRYVASGQISGARITTVCQSLPGSAQEVATVFVQTLSRAVRSRGGTLEAMAPFPRPSRRGACTSAILQAAASDVPGALRREYDELRRDLQHLFQ